MRSLLAWLTLLALAPLAEAAGPRAIPTPPPLPTIFATPTPEPTAEPAPPPPPPPAAPVGVLGEPNTGTAVAHRGSVARTSASAAPDPVPPLGLLWLRNMKGEVRTPLIAGGAIYVVVTRPLKGKEHLDERRMSLEAFALSNGKPLWSRELSDVYMPAYDAGRLFVSGPFGVRAFDATTGAPLWATAAPEDFYKRGWQWPAATGGQVYVTNGDSRVTSLSAADGRVLWSADGPEAGQSAVAVAGGRIVSSSGCRTSAYDALTGKQLWQGPFGCSGGGWGTPLIAGERAVDPAGRVFDLASGALQTQRVEGTVAAGGMMFAQASEQVRATGFDGHGRWAKAVKRTTSGSHVYPVAAATTIYALSDEGELFALDMATGRPRDQFRLFDDTSIMSAPMDAGMAVADGVLAVPISNRLFVFTSALRPKPGAVSLRLRYTDALSGESVKLHGRVGSPSAAPLTLERDAWPFGRFKAAGKVSVNPADGTFTETVRARVNTRFRVRGSRAQTLYAIPKASIRFGVRGRTVLARMRLKVASAGGKTIALYLVKGSSGRALRLGTGRLDGSGRATFPVRVRRTTPGKDGVVFCVRGLRSMGRPDALAKRCGAEQIRLRRR